jgi:hypothetical protein
MIRDDRHTIRSRIVRRWAKRLVMAAVVSVAGGCGTQLETGYKPRPLDASADVRKSYYASPFSDNAEASSKENGPAMRTGPGQGGPGGR